MKIENFAEAYRSKTDEEVLRLARERDQLTLEARMALDSELAFRGIHIPQDAASSSELKVEVETAKVLGVSAIRDWDSTGAFLAEVLRVHRLRFWLFIKLTGPAVVVGYLAVFASHNEGRAILREIFARGDTFGRYGVLAKVALIDLAGYLVSWLSFCFSFGAISAAIGDLAVGVSPSLRESANRVWQRVGSFLRLSLLLFATLSVALVAAGSMISAILWISRAAGIRVTHGSVLVISYGMPCLALLVTSRFGLAIPALIIEDIRAGQSMFRSDDLTAGKWLTLAALLGKSLIACYVAAVIPFYIPVWMGVTGMPPWCFHTMTIAALAGVTVVEPTLFVGFALLYCKASSLGIPEQLRAACGAGSTPC